MTLTYELSLDILKMYLHTKNEFSRSRPSKVRARTGQTHRQTYIQTHRQTHKLTDATKTIYHAAFAGGQQRSRITCFVPCFLLQMIAETKFVNISFYEVQNLFSYCINNSLVKGLILTRSNNTVKFCSVAVVKNINIGHFRHGGDDGGENRK